MLLGTEGKGGKGYRRYPPSSDVKGKLSPSWTEKVFFRFPHLRRTKPTIFLLKSILLQQHSIYVCFFLLGLVITDANGRPLFHLRDKALALMKTYIGRMIRVM